MSNSDHLVSTAARPRLLHSQRWGAVMTPPLYTHNLSTMIISPHPTPLSLYQETKCLGIRHLGLLSVAFLHRQLWQQTWAALRGSDPAPKDTEVSGQAVVIYTGVRIRLSWSWKHFQFHSGFKTWVLLVQNLRSSTYCLLVSPSSSHSF